MSPTHTHPPQSSPPPEVDSYAELLDVPVVSNVVPVVAAERLPVEVRPTRTWTTGSVTVAPGSVVKVVNAHPARSRLSLSAVGGLAYLGAHQESTTVGLGYPLGAANSESVTATGQITAPTAGQTIVTVTPPRGWYDVTVQGQQGGTTAAAADRNNMALMRGAATVYVMTISGFSGNIVVSTTTRMYLDGATALTVQSIATGTNTAVYGASIIATPAAPSYPSQVMTHRGAVWATVDPAGTPVVISYAAEFLDG